MQAAMDLHKSRSCKETSKDSLEGPSADSRKPESGEAKRPATNYKKTICSWNAKGKCRNGQQCRFAHGEEELQTACAADVDFRANAPSKGQKVSASVAPMSGSRFGERLDEPMKVQPIDMSTQPPPEKVFGPSGQLWAARSLKLQSSKLGDSGATCLPIDLDGQDGDFQFRVEWLRQTLNSCAYFDQQVHFESQVVADLPWSHDDITRLSF
jgi:hypothetical protein